MRKDRQQALKLRLKGKSYSEITHVLGVPKATLSDWLSNVILSPEIQKALQARTSKRSLEELIKRNKNQTGRAQERARIAQHDATSGISDISERDLLMIGVALYWAEGYKRLRRRHQREITSHPVSLTNSDPALVKIFLRFIRGYCRIPEAKIKASLRIFPHQNENKLLLFWRQETHILAENFMKTSCIVSKSSLGKRPFNRLPYGVIQVSVADTKLFHTIMGYIAGLKKIV